MRSSDHTHEFPDFRSERSTVTVITGPSSKDCRRVSRDDLTRSRSTKHVSPSLTSVYDLEKGSRDLRFASRDLEKGGRPPVLRLATSDPRLAISKEDLATAKKDLATSGKCLAISKCRRWRNKRQRGVVRADVDARRGSRNAAAYLALGAPSEKASNTKAFGIPKLAYQIAITFRVNGRQVGRRRTRELIETKFLQSSKSTRCSWIRIQTVDLPWIRHATDKAVQIL